ncbi:ABC transporter substrate-binding protein [Aureimonas leprariae]|nr:sugar ABC transporter substrate-binding protein [Aureimonas leprariae]
MIKTFLAGALGLALMSGTALADTTLKLVEVITSPARTETLKGLVAKFEQANPGTKVEITSLPWGEAFEKFATMYSAGDTPDVMEMPDTWVALYAKNGALESLEPYLAKWQYTSGLNDRALQFGRSTDGKTAYMLPYGFYMQAMFYNKKLFKDAGIAEPPKTLPEFLDASRKLKAIGKAGYCQRGGRGGLNDWTIFSNAVSGNNTFFKDDGTSTFADPDKVKGLAFLIDYYKEGLSPKDSINWAFNEQVAGFYSGTCAMLNQDPDALIAIDEKMKPEDYGVVPIPKGEAGKAFPVIGFAGWSMFANSSNKEASWKLIEALESPEPNVEWNKRTGALPVHKSAEKDPFYAADKFKGWFAELSDPNTVPTSLPSYLEEFAFFKDSMVVSTGQQALLGEISAEDLGKQWADYLTPAQQKFKSAQ